MRPTGEQIQIASAGYAATVTEVGATLRTLSHRGRPLIAGFAPDEPMPEFNGALLAPWPNRIRDGRYDFGGASHQLAVSEPARGTALHGLVAWQPWTVRSAGPDRAELATVLYPQRGYPFLLSLTARYTLDADGLLVEVAARNDGAATAPYGVSMHPWFVAGPEPLADWTFAVDAARVVTTDDRLLPTGSEPVGGELDFRGGGRRLGDTVLDHAFTDLGGGAGLCHATLVAPGGTGVDISWDRRCGWLQVCSGDEAGPALNRRALAVEPMTCPPDAFGSGTDLVRLEPGDRHEVWWRFAALG